MTGESEQKWIPLVGDTVDMQDAYNKETMIPVHFRGFYLENAVVIMNGIQMSIEKSRIFKHKSE